MTSLLPEVSTQWNPSNEIYLCPNLTFLASPWRYVDFQTGHFVDFDQFDSHIAVFGQVKIYPTCPFVYCLRAGHSSFTEFGQDVRP